MKFQKFNKKIDAWVKFEKKGNKTKILDVKEKHSIEPFKKIKKVY